MISIWSCTARYETTSRSCFLDKQESKTNVNRENNKTMYLLKRFNTDTLVSVKLKRTNISYQKLNWIGSLAEMLRISRSWCAFHGNALHKASVTVSKQACTVPYALRHSQFNNGQVYKGRRADALAPGAEEGRDKLRKAAGRSKYPLIRRYPNGETRQKELLPPYDESIVIRREPGELKHLSSRRKRKKHRIPK